VFWGVWFIRFGVGSLFLGCFSSFAVGVLLALLTRSPSCFLAPSRTSFGGGLYERKKKKNVGEPEMYSSQSAESLQGKVRLFEGARGLGTLLEYSLNGAFLTLACADSLFPVCTQSERRKRTFNTMGVTAGVRAAMDEAMGSLLAGVDNEMAAEEKLQAVMIAAKETGMSVEKIFSYFKNSTTDSSDLTPEEFGKALRSLSPTIFDLEMEEVQSLVDKFDADGDGKVSYPEFRHYCYYSINAVCWRAERLRMEKSGEMDRMEDEYHHVHDGTPLHNFDVGHPETVKLDLGEKIYDGNKLYWRSNVTIHIRMWHNEEISCITVLCWSETDDKHFPPLYINSDMIHVDEASIEGKVAQMASDQGKQKVQQTHEQLRKDVLKDFYSSHILARLKVPDASNPFPKKEIANKLPPLTPRTETLMPFLSLLSTDIHNIMIPMPENIETPPPFQKLKHISLDNFNELLADLSADQKHAKKLTTNAERMTKLLDMSLNAFKNAEGERKRKATMSLEKRRWLSIFTTWIVRQQVVQVKELLKNSPAYLSLLQETEEKKAAAKAGLELPPL
jgi:hypothetical protein